MFLVKIYKLAIFVLCIAIKVIKSNGAITFSLFNPFMYPAVVIFFFPMFTASKSRNRKAN